jgi:hypothetical protein
MTCELDIISIVWVESVVDVRSDNTEMKSNIRVETTIIIYLARFLGQWLCSQKMFIGRDHSHP